MRRASVHSRHADPSVRRPGAPCFRHDAKADREGASRSRTRGHLCLFTVCERSREPRCGRPVILWVDAHISPRLCPRISKLFAVEAAHVRDLGLREAEDPEIFERARAAEVVVFTKDEDFVDLVRRLGTPPQVLWLRCGNMSNARLWFILSRTLADAIELLGQGEPVVEITLPEGERAGRTRASSGRRERTRRG